MSKRANPTIVGIFVLGAIALVVAAVAVFGSGALFASHPRAVAFFQGSIQGLGVGAPVTLRGVPVGSVKAIVLRLDMRNMTPIIAVYLDFEPKRIEFENRPMAQVDERAPLKNAVAAGLHARLASESLVTGQLLVELDLDPATPTHLAGADPSTVEIPTSLSDIQKLKDVLSQIPVEEIARTALKTLQDIDRVVASPEIERLLKSTVSSVENLNALITGAHDDLGLLLANAVGSLEKTDKVLSDIDGLMGPNSAQRYDIDQSLKNLAAATRSLRAVAEQLDRKPNSLVLGK